MAGIRPLDDRVVVKQDTAKTQTDHGIILPDIAKEPQRTGKVISVGLGKLRPDGTRDRMQVSPGDTVVFGAYAGNLMTYGDEEYLVMRETDILGVVERV